MKGLFLTFFFIASAYAQNLALRVDKLFCGEIDPFIIGDACLVYGVDQDSTYGLLFDMDEFMATSLAQVKPGDLITVDITKADKIADPAKIVMVKKLGKEVDARLVAYEVADAQTFLTAMSAGAVEKHGTLTCLNRDFYDGHHMHGQIFLKTKLYQKSFQTYEIKSLGLEYTLSFDQDLSSVWAAFDKTEPDYAQFNKRNYQPATHRGHIKFKDLFGKSHFGQADLLLPEKALFVARTFKARLILSSVNGHWGSTATLNCRLSPADTF